MRSLPASRPELPAGWLYGLATLAILLTAACASSAPLSASTSSAASGARAATPQPGAQSGTIAGPIQYPADGIPPLAIYAIAIDGSRYYAVETIRNQVHYTMLGLRMGDYYVYATNRLIQSTGASAARTESPFRFGGGYTKAVQCGLDVTCTDHSMVAVHVTAGATADNIDPADWYVGPDFYPLIPGGGRPAITLPAVESANPTPTPVAQHYAQALAGAKLVRDQASCPVNTACVWLGAEHDGTAAAYFPATAGSNNDLYACAAYLFHDDTGWKFLDFQCNPVPTPFPALGASGRLQLGMGETGCINAHSAPALSARVLVCLPEGTRVTVDGGPQYVPISDPNPDLGIEYWWHVSGRGWVVHRYLRAAT
ncbi:MAG: hypothetical protein E6I53_00325 [Chloroflexi bacterium]|nr:MAG: hypothetical protein E6I53_00325 [Chloroflexota bacterium]